MCPTPRAGVYPPPEVAVNNNSSNNVPDAGGSAFLDRLPYIVVAAVLAPIAGLVALAAYDSRTGKGTKERADGRTKPRDLAVD